MKIAILFLSLLISGLSFSQNTERKTIYLNSDWNIVSDSNQAVYSYRATFVNGKNTFPMDNYGSKKDSLNVIPDSTRNNFTMLHGKYEWYTKNGNLFSEHLFNNGVPVYVKEFDKEGRLVQYFDFTQKEGRDPVSYEYTQFKKDGKVKIRYIFQCDEKGNWPVTR